MRGDVTGFEVRKEKNDDGKTVQTAYSIFKHEFRSTYPRHAPIPADQKNERLFREEFLNRMCEELAHVLYDHPLKDDIY